MNTSFESKYPGVSRAFGEVWKQLYSENRWVDKCPNYICLSNDWQMSVVLDLGAVVI